MSRRFFVAAAAAVAVLWPLGARADHVIATPTVTLETTGEYDAARFGTPARLSWSIACAPSTNDTTFQGGFELYSTATQASHSSVFSDFFTLAQSGSQELVLSPGLAVYPHGGGVGCSVPQADGGPHNDHADVDGTGLVIPPRVSAPMLLDAAGGMYMEGTPPPPPGVELMASLMVADSPLGDEKVTVVFEGAGVNFRQDFVNPNDAASRGEVKFTPTADGIVTHYVIKQPYGVESNRITIQIGAGGSEGGGSSGGGKGDDSGGCAAGGGGLSLLGLLGLAGLRRRRAARS